MAVTRSLLEGQLLTECGGFCGRVSLAEIAGLRHEASGERLFLQGGKCRHACAGDEIAGPLEIHSVECR